MISRFARQWGWETAEPARRRLGLTRKQLAAKAGLSFDTVRNVEQGRLKHPDPSALHRLCNALDLPLPGDGGIYLTADGVEVDRISRIVASALFEFARRRQDAKHFVAMLSPGRGAREQRQFRATVEADRDLAQELLSALPPDWASGEAPLPPTTHPRKKRRRPRHRQHTPTTERTHHDP